MQLYYNYVHSISFLLIGIILSLTSSHFIISISSAIFILTGSFFFSYSLFFNKHPLSKIKLF